MSKPLNQEIPAIRMATPLDYEDVSVPEEHVSVLEEAEHIINGQRRTDYGGPLESFGRIAEYWSSYLATRPGPPRPLSAEDVAMMMVMMKIARATNGFHRDSLVDIAGYAGYVELIHQERVAIADALTKQAI